MRGFFTIFVIVVFSLCVYAQNPSPKLPADRVEDIARVFINTLAKGDTSEAAKLLCDPDLIDVTAAEIGIPTYATVLKTETQEDLGRTYWRITSTIKQKSVTGDWRITVHPSSRSLNSVDNSWGLCIYVVVFEKKQ